MSTRPRVAQTEVSAAIIRIARRRAEIDDRSRDLLPDAPDSAPGEVLDYLMRHSGNNVPSEVRLKDAKDAIVLTNWMWWEDRRRELHFLKAAVEAGMFLNEIGGLIGVGKQGVKDRIDRLTALLGEEGRPDEKLMRAHRRAEQEQAGTEDSPAAHVVWLRANWPELKELVVDLNAQAERHGLKDSDREWLDELMIDVDEDRVNPQTMVMLGLATADIRVSTAFVRLPNRRPHAIHLLLQHADRMRTEYAGLGTLKR
ncbi:hypothetical protein ACFV9C_42515 [Kribbella sp. NPDC059898]|uniref:hypothetical protein n=1 Tax=Kribbella sp. NPDC059898 TaxID=3346995 RepID=UPI00365D25FF